MATNNATGPNRGYRPPPPGRGWPPVLAVGLVAVLLAPLADAALAWLSRR